MLGKIKKTALDYILKRESYFPVLVEYQDNGEKHVCNSPEEIKDDDNGKHRDFKVLEVKYSTEANS